MYIYIYIYGYANDPELAEKIQAKRREVYELKKETQQSA